VTTKFMKLAKVMLTFGILFVPFVTFVVPL